MLTWSYAEKEFTCIDKSGRSAITVERGEDGGIFFSDHGVTFEIDPSDIDHIFFEEPKLFKKGAIAFFDDDGDVLTYTCEGRNIPLFIDVARKDRDVFYLIFKIFQDNGFEVIAS